MVLVLIHKCLETQIDLYLEKPMYVRRTVGTFSKGGFKSEDVEGFSNLQKYIPFFYPKLS